MLKFNRITPVTFSVPKKSILLKEQPDATPTPAPSPEIPQTTPAPSSDKTKTAGSSDISTAGTETLPNGIDLTRKDQLFRLENDYYSRSSSAQTVQKAKTSSPAPIVKPSEQARLGGLVMMTDEGQSGTSSNGKIFDPQTGTTAKKLGLSAPASQDGDAQKVSPTLGIPKEYTELAQIIASLPEGFDLTGWDDMTAFQQQKAIRNSGLSKEDQMVMLNAGTSVETIAMIQGLQANRAVYGLTQNETDSLSKQLLEIANVRIGVKTHNYPIFSSNQMTRTFLSMLNERESALLAPFRQTPGSSESTLEKLQALGDKRTPLPIGKYISYNKIDLTESLNSFMYQSAVMLQEMQASARNKHVSFIPAFISAVKTGGPLDIKNQSAWKFVKGLEYSYRGMPLRNDDPGNIAFGYYGAAVFGEEFLQLGAGLYQLLSDIRNNEPIQTDGKYFDNPRDNEMIRYGYELYLEENKP